MRRFTPLLLLPALALAADPEPALTVTPVVVLVQRDLTGQELAGGAYGRQPVDAEVDRAGDPRTPTERAIDRAGECAVLVRLAVGDGWFLALHGESARAAATTSDGETLGPAAPVPDHERTVRQPPLGAAPVERSVSLRLRLPAPRRPALALRELSGDVEVVLARTDRLAQREYRPVAGSAPLASGIDGCDLTVSRGAADEIIIDHHADAMLRVHAIEVLDATGNPCQQRGGRSSLDGGRRQLAVRYQPSPDRIAISYYAEPKRARVRFALADVPLIGAPEAPAEPVPVAEVEWLRSLAAPLPADAAAPAAAPGF